MKTSEIKVSSQGLGWSEAMELTEKVGGESGLARKEQLRLRLLAEELIGMMRGIAGHVEAMYWLEREGKSFELHLKAHVYLNQEMRRELLAVSTSGENAAAKGFMGKIREMFLVATLPPDANSYVPSVEFMSMGSPAGAWDGFSAYVWSMNQYKTTVQGQDKDDLEKSIVASIADEVSVSMTGSQVEIMIQKAF